MGTIFLFLFMLGNFLLVIFILGGIGYFCISIKIVAFLFWDVVKFLRNILFLLSLYLKIY